MGFGRYGFDVVFFWRGGFGLFNGFYIWTV